MEKVLYGWSDKTEVSVARLALHGRILRCPVAENPKDCPLYEIRLLPIEKRIEWLNSKSEEQVEALYSYHIRCMDKKLSANPA